MFSDSRNSDNVMVLAVLDYDKKCPGRSNFAPITYASLLRVGAVRKEILTPPDWVFFLCVLVGFLMIITLAIMMIGYIKKRNWRQKDVPPIEYQQANYTAMKKSNPKEKEAIVSVNTEPQSF